MKTVMELKKCEKERLIEDMDDGRITVKAWSRRVPTCNKTMQQHLNRVCCTAHINWKALDDACRATEKRVFIHLVPLLLATMITRSEWD